MIMLARQGRCIGEFLESADGFDDGLAVFVGKGEDARCEADPADDGHRVAGEVVQQGDLFDAGQGWQFFFGVLWGVVGGVSHDLSSSSGFGFSVSTGEPKAGRQGNGSTSAKARGHTGA